MYWSTTDEAHHLSRMTTHHLFNLVHLKNFFFEIYHGILWKLFPLFTGLEGFSTASSGSESFACFQVARILLFRWGSIIVALDILNSGSKSLWRFTFSASFFMFSTTSCGDPKVPTMTIEHALRADSILSSQATTAPTGCNSTAYHSFKYTTALTAEIIYFIHQALPELPLRRSRAAVIVLLS
ncbi:MAG: hypothetical protein CM15mV106_140 [uncultured marine virus]|nr:MAG: hypothetical protein CM15mV106_140 [uncultured marine virus]